jgi:hypothetical protein
MSFPTVDNQDRAFLRDSTVCLMTGSNTGAATIALLGVIMSARINLKREFADVTAAADQFTSRRVTRWGEGFVDVVGFSQLTGSKFAALFAQGSTAFLQFTESSTGDVWQLVCCMAEFEKDLGLDATKDRLRLTIIGIPQYGAAGATPVNLSLE